MPFDPAVLFLILLTCLITAALSAVFGFGGGTVLVGVLINVFSSHQKNYIVPFHATVQSVSNFTRLTIFYRHIEWRIVRFFLLGMVPGALVGIQIFKLISFPALQILMGLFILTVTFAPVPGKKGGPVEEEEKEEKMSFLVFLPVGFGVGLLGVIFGATGALSAPFYLRKNVLKERLIATKAFCQLFTHITKIALYTGVAGVNLLPLWPLLALCILMVIGGTFLGKYLLEKLPARGFKIGLQLLLLLMSLRILYQGMEKTFGSSWLW